MSKVCSTCKVIKDVSNFYRDGDGIGSRCKECEGERNKQYHANNKPKIKKTKKKWYLDNKQQIIEDRKEKRKADPRYNMLSTAKHRAKKSGIPFSLRLEDVSIPTHCPILGIELLFNKGVAGKNSPSLDKIVPVLGYVPDNVQVISKLANSMKTNASIAELKLFAKWVLTTFKEEE